MTLFFMDGFDHENNFRKWEAGSGHVYNASAGRFGGGSMSNNTNGNTIIKNITTASVTLIMAGAIQITFTGATGSDKPLFQIFDTTLSAVQVSLVLEQGTGDITVRTGGITGAELDRVAKPYTNGAWHYLEWKVLIDGTGGTSEVRFDEVIISNVSTVDTREGLLDIGKIVVGADQGNQIDWDDIIIMDGAGSVNNNFLGDMRITTLAPDGDSVEQDFSRSTGLDNFALVDEVPQDDDTSYVESATATDTDRYTFTALGTSPASIAAVAVNTVARKDDAGGRSIIQIIESGASEDNSASKTLQTTFDTQQHIAEVDPQGGGAWTEARVDAMTAGQEVV